LLFPKTSLNRKFTVLYLGDGTLLTLFCSKSADLALGLFSNQPTVFPYIRPASIIFLLGLPVLLEITKFHLHRSVSGAGIIRNAGIIQGRALYEEIRYVTPLVTNHSKKSINTPKEIMQNLAN
jgi:hypothetical protein